jgi:hypothetical protein
MEPLSWTSVALFIGGIVIKVLADKFAPVSPPPVNPVNPAPTPVNPAVPQLGDGHILKALLEQLILALQKSKPASEGDK